MSTTNHSINLTLNLAKIATYNKLDRIFLNKNDAYFLEKIHRVAEELRDSLYKTKTLNEFRILMFERDILNNYENSITGKSLPFQVLEHMNAPIEKINAFFLRFFGFLDYSKLHFNKQTNEAYYLFESLSAPKKNLDKFLKRAFRFDIYAPCGPSSGGGNTTNGRFRHSSLYYRINCLNKLKNKKMTVLIAGPSLLEFGLEAYFAKGWLDRDRFKFISAELFEIISNYPAHCTKFIVIDKNRIAIKNIKTDQNTYKKYKRLAKETLKLEHNFESHDTGKNVSRIIEDNLENFNPDGINTYKTVKNVFDFSFYKKTKFTDIFAMNVLLNNNKKPKEIKEFIKVAVSSLENNGGLHIEFRSFATAVLNTLITQKQEKKLLNLIFKKETGNHRGLRRFLKETKSEIKEVIGRMYFDKKEKKYLLFDFYQKKNYFLLNKNACPDAVMEYSLISSYYGTEPIIILSKSKTKYRPKTNSKFSLKKPVNL